MKTKLLNLLALGSGLLLMQSCSKEAKQLTGPPADGKAPVLKTSSVVSSYGTFYISNVSSGKVMEVLNTYMLTDGGAIQQNPYAGTGTATAPNQKWIVIQQGTGTITSTTKFKIMNVASGKYLEVPLAGTTPGTQLWQDKANTNNAQLWYIQTSGTGSYKIVNVGNSLVVADHGSSTANGAPITQETFVSGNTSQQWVLNSIAVEAYRDDAVVQYFRRPKVSGTTVAFDVGTSIPLTNGANNGKSIWLGGDSNDANGLQTNGLFICGFYFFEYHNSALIQPASHSWDPTLTPNLTTTNSPSQPLQIFATPGGDNTKSYTWPGPGIEVSNHVYVYAYEAPITGTATAANQVLYNLTENTGSNAWGSAVRTTVTGLSGQPSDTAGRLEINYKEGMVKPGDGYVYVFGSHVTFFDTQNLYVARFATGTPTTWQFWNGTAWVSTRTLATAAAITVGSSINTHMNTNISYVNGKYVLVESDLGYFCDPSPHNIYISTSTSPTGPFTTQKLVFTINDMFKSHLARFYAPVVHPEFNNSHNELLITYALNYAAAGGSCSTDNCNDDDSGRDPYYYQLKAVRVPYSLIGL